MPKRKTRLGAARKHARRRRAVRRARRHRRVDIARFFAPPAFPIV